MAQLRVAVVSDIHAGSKPSEWTHVVAEPPSASAGDQPLADLFHFVRSTQLRADYLVAPGDIANQADGIGLQYAWRVLHSLATEMGARLVGAPGNHDVITHDDVPDGTVLLRNLLPSFPVGEPAIDDQFWVDGFAILEEPTHRVVVLNSTYDFPAYPSGFGPGTPEWNAYLNALDRGSFPNEVEGRLDQALEGLDPKINLLVVHHHPQEHQLKDQFKDTYGPMHRGDALLALLHRHHSVGRWVLLHGHKHIPQLVHAGGAVGTSVTVMCAASAGASIWPPHHTVTRNQFHVLNLEDDSLPGLGTLRGTVESYFWAFSEGWMPPQRRGSGLPAVTGFGCTDDHRDLASQVAHLMNSEALEFMDVPELHARLPRLRYQVPVEFELFEQELLTAGFFLSRDYEERVHQVVRKVLP